MWGEEQLKETAQWALERQNQQLEELKRQTREAEEHRRAAASEAAAISKRMAVQHVFARAASKSKKLERQIQHKEEELKKTQAKEEKEHLDFASEHDTGSDLFHSTLKKGIKLLSKSAIKISEKA